MREIMQMSKKELNRVHIIRKLLDKQITQSKAAELLGLKSDRQVRNLLNLFKEQGEQGLVSKQRGKPSNRSRQLDSPYDRSVLLRQANVDIAT